MNRVKTFFVPIVPKSPNKVLGKHWGIRAREAKRWREQIRASAGKPRSDWPKGPKKFTVIMYLRRIYDPQNVQGAAKPIEDALVHLRWLDGDTERHGNVPDVSQAPCRENGGKCGTWISIETITP